MKKNVWGLPLLLLLLTLTSCSNTDDTVVGGAEIPSQLLDDILLFADKQYRVAVEQVETTQETNSKQVTLIGEDHDTGDLVMGKETDWRGGFFPASLWILYEMSHDDFWLEKAQEQTYINRAAASMSSHDLGFKINNSWGRAYKILHERKYYDILKEAADTMTHRYNPNVGCIRCWKSEDDNKYLIVIIDNMMNIELLFNMTQLTGDSTYYNIAKKHADTTMRNHFRENNSSYHVVEYNIGDGSVKSRYTAQGCSDESYWSRGQSWGLYGFTMSYRFTKDTDYLDQAKKIANFLLGLQYDDDYIPYWDMLAPDIPNTPRDASAAAIMASALVELSTYCVGTEKELYQNHAIKIVKSLHDNYQCQLGCHHGFLLLHSTQNYNTNDKVDSPLVYADYYYLEAVQRLRALICN